MNSYISYLIRFLIGGSKAAKPGCRVGYTANPRTFTNYSIVIIPSGFFDPQMYGTSNSMPELPLQEIDGIPLLFGTPKIEWQGVTLVVYADIIASAYFLLTRYEEIRRRDIRDEHGRFPGKESLPYRAGFLHRPVVDEYGKLLRKWLRETGVPVTEPEERIRKVWLTHDVDAPFYCRSFRNVIRETIKGKGFKKAISLLKGSLNDDQYYTFPWLLEQDGSVRKTLGKTHCDILFFLKAGGKSEQDKPRYKLNSADGQSLLSLLKNNKVLLGLHSSYDAGKNPAYISDELRSLERVTKQKIRYNRHHYLDCREPEDFLWLERAGIREDFTMGYADVAGFRLGTARPVRWINPVNKRISSLVLHPLTMMDVALSEKKYMNLNYEEALEYCLGLIKQVQNFNGELIMLWHNDMVSQIKTRPEAVDWHPKLYTTLLEEVKKR